MKNGVKNSEIISEYKLKDYYNLTQIKKNEKKIIAKYESIKDKISSKTYRLKDAKYPEVEESLVIWMRQMRSNKAKKAVITRYFRYLRGLKHRNGVIFMTEHGESDSVAESTVQKWTQELADLIKDKDPKCVYNLDELSLFWRLLPSKTYGFDTESKSGKKKYKDKITLVMISNADGSDRYIIMIGKSAKPRSNFNFNRMTITTTIQISEEVECDDNVWNQLKDKTNLAFNTFEEYVTFDDNIVDTEEHLTDEQIVAEVMSTTNTEHTIQSDEEEIDNPINDNINRQTNRQTNIRNSEIFSFSGIRDKCYPL
ncbi:tigger transposable element-derived protein 4-like [Oppia nitens]|uniref:tigger transposable element-derived protein 4-like n=1 Tax=Oppia nitens TaxID=1686743 RepID=UPI0023D9C2C5|nr:tigger transposable element-derived protein 4-like [Oppia nitens]